MDKTQDVFFEVVLKNASAILLEAHYMRQSQDMRLTKNRSRDRTADAAIDNVMGGRMSINSNGELRSLRNVACWAEIIGKVRMHFREQKNQLMFNVFQLAYMEARSNRDCMGKLKLDRHKFFAVKNEIKNLVCASACEMGIWHAVPGKR